MKTSPDNPSHRKRLGAAIRAKRKVAGVSQEKLAEIADVHRNYVGLVERGEQNLTVEMLFRFARSLRCKPSSLLVDAGY